jgi:hypothetical protein
MVGTVLFLSSAITDPAPCRNWNTISAAIKKVRVTMSRRYCRLFTHPSGRALFCDRRSHEHPVVPWNKRTYIRLAANPRWKVSVAIIIVGLIADVF